MATTNKGKEIQNTHIQKALKSIFTMIPENRKPILKTAMGCISGNSVIIIFNKLYAFEYKWQTKKVLCINGSAKSIAIDSLQFNSSPSINMYNSEKKMKLKGSIVWQKGL